MIWYILITASLLFGIVFTTGFSCQNPVKENKNTSNSVDPTENFGKEDSVKGMFSKKQILEKLKLLEETPTSVMKVNGAMCYFVAPSLNKIHEYICPICGEKTIYKKSKNQEQFDAIDGILEFKLNACRKELEKVNGINIKLDESEYCAHCKPNIDFPKLYLMVNIAGQKDTNKITEFDYTDIRLISEFLNGQLIHKGINDDERPLVENIGRIKDLLGIK